MSFRSANDLTPAAEQVERFRRDLEAIGTTPSAEDRLALAVSGGADSLALLLLATAAFPGAIVAATVDHCLRPEAAQEAAFVGKVCARLGVPHEILSGGVGAGNLQEQARELRYALLRDWAGSARARWIATAHQRDDVAETFLMRARRGAGVNGLAAMPAIRDLGPDAAPVLVRPLLDWSRDELAAIVAAAGLEPVLDPSNRDPRYDRVRIRRLLAQSPELPAERLARAARNLRHAEEALEWVVEREWLARSRALPDGVALDPAGLPYELRRRLAGRAVDCIRPGPPAPLRGEALDRFVATLLSGGTGTIAGVKACVKRAEWHFSPAPARRSH